MTSLLFIDSLRIANSYELAASKNVLATEESSLYDPEQHIDHIFFANNNSIVTDFQVDARLFGKKSRPPSDHFAMIAEFQP